MRRHRPIVQYPSQVQLPACSMVPVYQGSDKPLSTSKHVSEPCHQNDVGWSPPCPPHVSTCLQRVLTALPRSVLFRLYIPLALSRQPLWCPLSSSSRASPRVPSRVPPQAFHVPHHKPLTCPPPVSYLSPPTCRSNCFSNSYLACRWLLALL